MISDSQHATLATRRQVFIEKQVARAERTHSPQREKTLRKWSTVIFWALFVGILAAGSVQAELVWLGLFATFWGGLDIGLNWWRKESAYDVGLGTFKSVGGLSVLAGALSLATRSFPKFGIALLFSGGFVILFTLLVRELKVGVLLNEFVGVHSRRGLMKLSFNTYRLLDALRNDWNYAKVHTQLFFLESLEVLKVKLSSATTGAKSEWSKRTASASKLRTYP